MKSIKLSIRKPYIPYVILIICLLITFLSTIYVIRGTDQMDQLRFENAIQETQNNISTRIETYVSLLRGNAGMITAFPDITEVNYRKFLDRADLSQRYPGIQGIGYIQKISNENKQDFIDTQREKGIENYSIVPEREAEEYYPIVYLEPKELNENEVRIGFDVSTNTPRWKAMQRARDTGVRAASEAVILGQTNEQENKQRGFLIYLPIYSTSVTPESIDKRRETLSGFVYAPFKINDILLGIIGTDSNSLINFKVYDGDKPEVAMLLYDSQSLKNSTTNYIPRYISHRHINIAGHTWTIEFTNNQQFEVLSQRGLAPIILLSGLILSFVLFVLSRSEYLARKNAEVSYNKLSISQRELQRAIGIRDNFISIASHELKTPVTSLKVYTEVFLKYFKNKKDTKNIEYMQKMNRQIDKLTVLIRDLLDVSRLQSGRMSFREEEINITNVVKEVIEQINTINTTHTIMYTGISRKKILGDEDRLGQVVNNFLTNAIKYSPKADKIKITVKDQKNGVTVAVQDFGIGMDAKHLKRIFRRFYRVADTNEQTYPGLGMGLYICNEIIKRHNGEINVSSTKGKGSIFSFTIPYLKSKK